MINRWLVVRNSFYFSIYWELGMSSSQLTNSYFPEGLFYHQPDINVVNMLNIHGKYMDSYGLIVIFYMIGDFSHNLW